MPRPLRLWSAVTRPALLRSAALFAATAAAGPLFGQALPPGAMAAPGGDPFAGGAFAVPTAGPVAVAYGDPATLSPGTIISAQGMPADGTVISGPMPGGTQTFMAPQVIGGSPQMMGSPMPGSPGCNCGPGGASFGSPMMDPSMMGMPMGTPSYGAPMMGPTYGGGAPGYYDDGCCLNDGCCLDALCGAPAVGPCDPCQTGVPVCDPCQSVPPAYAGPGGGIYHGMGGAPRCGWSTSFTWVFLKPYYSSNEAFSVSDGLGGTQTTDFGHSLDLSPRVSVEWVSRSDWGLRATWFGYENDSDTETAVVPGGGAGFTPLGQFAPAGTTINANSEFDIDTIDFDATQRLRVGKSLVNVGGGIRWMGYEHDYRSTITGGGTATGDASRQFDGAGPTVFAEWRRPIGSSRFSLLASVRGSLLYGTSEFDSATTGGIGPPVLGFNSVTHAEADDFVATGETQLGGEWSAWIGRQTVLFIQVAYEGQALLGVGTALDENDDLGLHGFNTKVGLEW